MTFDTFAIGFDQRDRVRAHAFWEGIFERQQWSGGPLTEAFETAWGEWNSLPAVAMSSWTGAALAALNFFEVRDKTVLCPSNTFMATPLAVKAAGGQVAFVDCNREDLCMSLADLERKVADHRPHAVFLVHIGGHIAFDVKGIAELCRAEGIVLIEDCAHAHGAAWNERKAGVWGDAGIWSFAPTKTVTTGEGGMVVSRHAELIDYARSYREYGKPHFDRPGLNFRMSEFTAALGILAVERLDEIQAWKNETARELLDPLHPNRVQFPDGMISGLYKYIVFDEIEHSTGKVYEEPCHRLMGHAVDLPDTDWVALNHWCVPLYYRPGALEPVAEAAE